MVDEEVNTLNFGKAHYRMSWVSIHKARRFWTQMKVSSCVSLVCFLVCSQRWRRSFEMVEGKGLLFVVYLGGQCVDFKGKENDAEGFC